jgi:hypothetical protein
MTSNHEPLPGRRGHRTATEYVANPPHKRKHRAKRTPKTKENK